MENNRVDVMTSPRNTGEPERQPQECTTVLNGERGLRLRGRRYMSGDGLIIEKNWWGSSASIVAHREQTPAIRAAIIQALAWLLHPSGYHSTREPISAPAILAPWYVSSTAQFFRTAYIMAIIRRTILRKPLILKGEQNYACFIKGKPQAVV